MASKLVIIIVFILDLIAVGLAIAAEQRRSVVRIVTLSQTFINVRCSVSCSDLIQESRFVKSM
ncbi:hypothetical protein DY000_02010431 [Brassica cretica]|uniref:Secreted protein n=1 Tax=Brassica cretica TaxID=69181 RepID=A0ABQ7BRS5_BRACR|nr:hypothetical protein DY000_02010431 [Brassica cretica]